jgi:ABC-type glycerol-3-phosphate transport system substrate-binding protein
MRNSMRIGRRAALAGMAGAAVAPVAQAQAPVTLRIFTGGQQRPDVMRRILDVFQERNPGIRAEVEVGGATSDQQHARPSGPPRAGPSRSMPISAPSATR